MTEEGSVDMAETEDEVRAIVQEELEAFSERLISTVRSVVSESRTDPQAIAVEAAAIIQQQQQQAAADLGAQIEQAKAASAEQPSNNTNPTPAASLIKGVSGLNKEVIFGALEQLFEMFMKFDEARWRRQDHFAWAERLSQERPALAAFIGSALSPDPMQQHIPRIQEQAANSSFQYGFRTGLKAAGATIGSKEVKPPPNPLEDISPPSNDNDESENAELRGFRRFL